MHKVILRCRCCGGFAHRCGRNAKGTALYKCEKCGAQDAVILDTNVFTLEPTNEEPEDTE